MTKNPDVLVKMIEFSLQDTDDAVFGLLHDWQMDDMFVDTVDTNIRWRIRDGEDMDIEVVY